MHYCKCTNQVVSNEQLEQTIDELLTEFSLFSSLSLIQLNCGDQILSDESVTSPTSQVYGIDRMLTAIPQAIGKFLLFMVY